MKESEGIMKQRHTLYHLPNHAQNDVWGSAGEPRRTVIMADWIMKMERLITSEREKTIRLLKVSQTIGIEDYRYHKNSNLALRMI